MFAITGLPRSRTYWLSRYFSAIPGVHCWHELTNLCPPADFHALWECPGALKLGNSDSGLHITDFQRRWPAMATIIIERDPEEVHYSLVDFFERMGFPEPPMSVVMNQLEAMKDLNGLRISFDDIDDRMEEIHSHLGIPYDQAHHADYAGQRLEMPELVVNVENYRAWFALGETE